MTKEIDILKANHLESDPKHMGGTPVNLRVPPPLLRMKEMRVARSAEKLIAVRVI